MEFLGSIVEFDGFDDLTLQGEVRSFIHSFIHSFHQPEEFEPIRAARLHHGKQS